MCCDEAILSLVTANIVDGDAVMAEGKATIYSNAGCEPLLCQQL